jgi:hypothetical protein
MKSCSATSFSLVVYLSDTTFLSSCFVSKICECKYPGDTPRIAFKTDIRQTHSILLHLCFLFFPLQNKKLLYEKMKGGQRRKRRVRWPPVVVGGCCPLRGAADKLETSVSRK